MIVVTQIQSGFLVVPTNHVAVSLYIILTVEMMILALVVHYKSFNHRQFNALPMI